MPVLKADYGIDDYNICQIAKKSKYTRDFVSHRFFRDDIENTYAKGEVGVATHRGKTVGFVYVKHLKIKSRPYSVVHYMGSVKPGTGRLLLAWALETSPHGVVELSCEESNDGAVLFYRACGFQEVGRGVYGGKRPYIRFRKERV